MKSIIGPALILIDVQVGIDDAGHWGGNRNNPQAEQQIERLLSAWRKENFPVVIVQHCSVSPNSPFHPDQDGNRLKEFVKVISGEKLVQKSTANAFVKTDLQQYLMGIKVNRVVIVGFVTNNSVEATARYAGDLGYDTIVVSDATASFDKLSNGQYYPSDLIHRISLANLENEYASILTTDQTIDSITPK